MVHEDKREDYRLIIGVPFFRCQTSLAGSVGESKGAKTQSRARDGCAMIAWTPCLLNHFKSAAKMRSTMRRGAPISTTETSPSHCRASGLAKPFFSATKVAV